MEEIMNIISTVGFPIACVIGCGWFLVYIFKTNREDTQKREDKMNLQIDKFSDSLNNFNDTLIRIDARLEVLEKKVD